MSVIGDSEGEQYVAKKETIPSSNVNTQNPNVNTNINKNMNRATSGSLYSQILASASASAIAQLCLNPVAVIKVGLQNARQKSTPRIMDICSKVLSNDGMLGFWRGWNTGMAQALPSTVIYMTTYEKLKKELYQRDEQFIPSAWVPGVAGAIGRTIAVSFTSPVELVRTIQVSGQKGSFKSIAMKVYNTDGWSGLYRGWLPTIMRDVPFSALYWYNFESSRYMFRDKLLENEIFISYCSSNSSNISSSSSSSSSCHTRAEQLANFAAGAFAGFTSALITHPFDVIKTRRQIDSKAETSTWRGLVKAEGINALWKGLGMRLATVIPGGAVMVTVYEYVKKYAV